MLTKMVNSTRHKNFSSLLWCMKSIRCMGVWTHHIIIYCYHLYSMTEHHVGSPRNLLAVIGNVDHGFYKLYTENGVLKHKYMRSQLVPWKEILLDLKTLLESSGEKEITLQEVAGCNSLMGTQGGRIGYK